MRFSGSGDDKHRHLHLTLSWLCSDSSAVVVSRFSHLYIINKVYAYLVLCLRGGLWARNFGPNPEYIK